MNINLDQYNISDSIKQEINNLLKVKQGNRSDLEQMWYLMDIVWDQLGCNNRNYDWDRINQFYAHPVWLLNGLFIEHHEISMQHRHAISNWIVDNQQKYDIFKVVDYGGGHGTLARLIADKSSDVEVSIFEPAPNEYSIDINSQFDNIKFVEQLDTEYDCLVSTDVLEHTPNPLEVLCFMVNSVKQGGVIIIANNFYPVIKCHLPDTFHLRYSFDQFAILMGLTKLGHLTGSHAKIYYKLENTNAINWRRIKLFEQCSKKLYPIIKAGHFYGSRIKRVMRL